MDKILYELDEVEVLDINPSEAEMRAGYFDGLLGRGPDFIQLAVAAASQRV
ncbi:Hypothetical predicted protein [Olea europaea subsp. europaea]|uniref:Uncharacterized protein n=1 Tax=Olea europaea subsp. europaea TaxID=158383 RepID=A0A8S0UWF8_OLEEU|nr:Hypothetical predicted protein [Olea europaea subsp. europaea]